MCSILTGWIVVAEDVKEFAKSMEQRESRRSSKKGDEVESEQDEKSEEEEKDLPKRRSASSCSLNS